MTEDQEIQVTVHLQEEPNPNDQNGQDLIRTCKALIPQSKSHRRWLWMILYTFFVLSGQAVATLLGRQYYDNGGKSKWMETLVQFVGFPVLLPYYLLSPIKEHTSKQKDVNLPLSATIGSVYILLGLIEAAVCYLYSIGLLYLPVSTYSLVCASQVAFNAIFAYFLNSQKFTPFIINALVLLTLSSTVLAFDNEATDPTKVDNGKYAKGFICTIGASAGHGLILSLQQLASEKIIKRQTISAVMDMTIYHCLVASVVSLVGLFVSDEWNSSTYELKNYKLGKVSYVINLVCTAISWQVYTIGSTGLIFELSSLFANAITALGLPVIPILAVIIFNEKMDGLKEIAMVLAIWGFASYVYQHYLDEQYSKSGHEISKTESVYALLPEEGSG